jgi:hypothetical protein
LPSAGGSPSADVRTILVQRHSVRGAGDDLRGTPINLDVPRLCCARLRLAVEASQQLKRELGAFLNR